MLLFFTSDWTAPDTITDITVTGLWSLKSDQGAATVRVPRSITSKRWPGVTRWLGLGPSSRPGTWALQALPVPWLRTSSNEECKDPDTRRPEANSSGDKSVTCATTPASKSSHTNRAPPRPRKFEVLLANWVNFWLADASTLGHKSEFWPLFYDVISEDLLPILQYDIYFPYL